MRAQRTAAEMADENDGKTPESKASSQDVVYNWTDITKDFLSACSDLNLGELMHDSNFGLFEAMSAIEMMDPKMDAGMMCNQVKRKVLNFEQSVEAGVVKIQGLTFHELIGIIDDTLSCLVTWLEGHSLAQTMFTNLYLHNPYIIEDRVLKAFSINMLKTIDLIRDRVNRAGVFEEEDFQPMTYGFKLAADVTDVRASGMMKEIEDDLNRTIKNTRSKPGEQRDADVEKEHQLTEALFSRIRFCRLLLTTLITFSKEKPLTVNDVHKLLAQMSGSIRVMQSSLHFGIKPPEAEETASDYPTIMGFEPLVNQRLLPPTIPRYAKIRCRDETMEYLLGLVDRLKAVCGITELTNLHVALEFFFEFSKTSPCVLSRSLLQLVFLPPNRRVWGSHNIVDVFRDTIRTFINPPALMPRNQLANNAQAKDYIDTFLTHAVRPICSVFQISGHNRARQRDKYGHLLEDLANLQDEADKVDAYLHSMLKKLDPNRQHLACFGNWVLCHTLQVMINYLLAGFELELYAVHEYHYIFWYLYECLYNWFISMLSRADSFLLEQEAITEQQQKGRVNKKTKKKRKTRPHTRAIIEGQAAQNLCGGYYKAIVGLTMDNKLPMPKFDFDSEEVRYNHRFAPFGHVGTPPPIQYPQFKEMTDVGKFELRPTSADMYRWSCKCFQQAKSLYESLPSPNEEIQTLIKISKTNFVVIKLLLGGHKKDSTTPPEFDFSSHKIFPVIKFQ